VDLRAGSHSILRDRDTPFDAERLAGRLALPIWLAGRLALPKRRLAGRLAIPTSR
jgi:hypothetical protein